MSTPARLGLFVAALGVVFAGAFAAGSVVDPNDGTPQPVPTVTVASHAAHGGSAPTTTP